MLIIWHNLEEKFNKLVDKDIALLTEVGLTFSKWLDE